MILILSSSRFIMLLIRSVTAAGAAFALAASAIAATPQSEIAKANATFEKAIGAGDSATIAQLYATDAKAFPNGMEPASGREAIGKLMEGFIAGGIGGAKLTTKEIYPDGRMATEVGLYQLTDKAGKQVDHGSYIVIWKHEGSQWKLFRDMFVSSVAPAK